MIPSGHSIHTVQGQETGVIPIYECQEIYRSGVYVLARDISGVYPKKDYCIGIFAVDVVLDGNGHSMTSQYYGDGIYVEASDNVTIKNLRISKYGTGIYIYDTFPNWYSRNITIVGNTIDSNQYGIYLRSSNSNTIANNTISFNRDGIRIDDSNNNIIVGNIITSNEEAGIYLKDYSSGNMIYNNLFRNTWNAVFDLASGNHWNTTKTPGANIVGGPYLGGNYWGSPNGTGFSDICRDSDRDGICDEPHVIDEINIDYLPLAKYGIATTPTSTPSPTPSLTPTTTHTSIATTITIITTVTTTITRPPITITKSTTRTIATTHTTTTTQYIITTVKETLTAVQTIAETTILSVGVVVVAVISIVLVTMLRKHR
jgi:parallel beta-helix repeat protein